MLTLPLTPSHSFFLSLTLCLSLPFPFPALAQAYLGMEDSAGVRLFMEYAGDSDAYSYINAKQRLSLREDDAQQLVYDVLTALHYMHSQVWVRVCAWLLCGLG